MVDWKTIDYDTMSLDEVIELVTLYAKEDPYESKYRHYEDAIDEVKRKGRKSVLIDYFDMFAHKDPKTRPLSENDWQTCWWLAVHE